MRIYYRILMKFVLTIIGIILIAAIPALFQGIKLDVSAYISAVVSNVSGLFHLNALTISHFGETYPVFPDLWEQWGYSITLIFIGFSISFMLALVLTVATMFLPEKARERIKFIFFLGESIPDVLVIGLTMVGVVFIYKHTDMLILEIVANNGEKIYALPIIVLALIPTMLLYRIMMYDFEEEASKLYTDIAKSKGLTTGKILFSHIFRNAMIHIFLHAKSMLAFLLSNLLIVEYVFNLDGLMGFMFNYFSPEILTVGMLSIFVPAYVLQAIGQIIIEKKTGRQVEV